MPTPFLIGAGSGLVSAALFGSAATATALAGLLFYLAPLPICLAGLGWGSVAALVSALAGTLFVSLVLGPATGSLFAFSIAFPIAFLTYLALLSRAPSGVQDPATLPNDGSVGPAGAVEWYPPGRLVAWAALIAGCLAAVLVLILGYDQDSYRESIRQMLEHSAIKDLDKDGTLFTEENVANLSQVIARALPAAFAIVWLTIALFNLWLAGLIVQSSGRAQRPWPDLHALELPNFLVLIFAVALAASFIPGVVGLVATGFAGALLCAYVLQGLAVLHVYSLNMPGRAFLLAAVYLGILLLGWVALLVAIIGLAEPMLGLRQRGRKPTQPPDNKI